jgi:hypothetical protein
VGLKVFEKDKKNRKNLLGPQNKKIGKILIGPKVKENSEKFCLAPK